MFVPNVTEYDSMDVGDDWNFLFGKSMQFIVFCRIQGVCSQNFCI